MPHPHHFVRTFVPYYLVKRGDSGEAGGDWWWRWKHSIHTHNIPLSPLGFYWLPPSLSILNVSWHSLSAAHSQPAHLYSVLMARWRAYYCSLPSLPAFSPCTSLWLSFSAHQYSAPVPSLPSEEKEKAGSSSICIPSAIPPSTGSAHHILTSLSLCFCALTFRWLRSLLLLGSFE